MLNLISWARIQKYVFYKHPISLCHLVAGFDAFYSIRWTGLASFWKHLPSKFKLCFSLNRAAYYAHGNLRWILTTIFSSRIRFLFGLREAAKTFFFVARPLRGRGGGKGRAILLSCEHEHFSLIINTIIVRSKQLTLLRESESIAYLRSWRENASDSYSPGMAL